MMNYSRHDSGFTLIEMAVVLAILVLLIGGMLVPLSAQQDLRARSETQARLAEARDALLGFAMQNGRLPCPANRSVSSGSAGAGAEVTTGSGTALECSCTTAASGIAGGTTACTAASVTGVLPWATLGLPEIDAWGYRYTYRMTTIFGRGIDTGRPTSAFGAGCTPDTAPQRSAFALCTPGNIEVLVTSGGTTIANSLPAVIVSHGRANAGAWTTGGAQVSGAAGDEAENADADITFIGGSNVDDMVAWLSPFLLSNRMIAAGRLP